MKGATHFVISGLLCGSSTVQFNGVPHEMRMLDHMIDMHRRNSPVKITLVTKIKLKQDAKS